MSEQLRLDVHAAMRLRLGDVVTKEHRKLSGEVRSITRGVVTELEARGWLGDRSAVVTRGGSSTYTDYGVGEGPDDWRLVPYEDQTWEERVRSAAARWTPVHESWSEEEDFAWAMMLVFVPELDEYGDWPSDFFELAIHYARHLDSHDSRALDAVIGRLELTALQFESIAEMVRELRRRPLASA